MDIIYTSLEKFISDNLEHVDLIKNKYIDLLNQLTITPYISTQVFLQNVKKISSSGIILIGYINKIGYDDFDIICSGTLYLEPKIIRSGKSVGHIEDIVVKKDYRGQKISQNILNKLKVYAIESDCYKVILDCDESVKPVYESNGFEVKGIQMAKYF